MPPIFKGFTMKKYVAVPVGLYGRKGAYLDYWNIYLDTGIEYPHGSIHFNSLRYNMERIKVILKQAKKDYESDVQAFMDSRVYTPRRGDSSRMRRNRIVQRQLIESRQNTIGI